MLYTPRNTSIDEVCAILASGKNVATTAFLFHPRRTTRRTVTAWRRHAMSAAFGARQRGLNPGNLSGVLPLALSGMATIDKITLQERADWSVYESTSITFDNMAFGQPVEDISPSASEFLAFNSGFHRAGLVSRRRAERRHRRRHRLCRSGSGQQDHQISITCWGPEPPRSAVDLDRPPRRWPLVEIEALWTVGGEYPEHWPTPEHGWTLSIG